ncbi:MAG: hypothetical protein JXA66_08750 [Oligoflexia bacterium]|nr:hypothetical protein [Oligoflexia bacterium]
MKENMGLFGLDKLPGKEMPLIAGFNIDHLRKIFPAVKTVRIINSKNELVQSCYSLMNEKFEQIARLDLIVAQKSCAEAYKALFATYALSEEDTALKANDKIKIGDLCLLSGNSKQPRRLDFVRNNIAVKIANKKRGNLDVVKIAGMIDEVLKKEPVFDSLEKSEKLPVIDRFEMENNNLKFSEKTSINYEVKNPEGGKMEYLFENQGGSVNRVSGDSDEYYYRAGHERGTYDIVLYAINQRNLVAGKRISLSIL